MPTKRIKTGGAMPRRSAPAPRNFIELDDCPHTYTGKAGQLPVVNATETGLEFKTEPVIDRHDVQITNLDTTPNFLNDKIVIGTGLTKTVLTPAGNETLELKLAAHDLAGALHNADTITNLNLKLSDGDVISTKAAEISALTDKPAPLAADLIMIESAADANAKRKISISALPAAAPAAHALAGALHNADTITNLNLKLSDGDVISTKAGEIAALTDKPTPLAADFLMIESAADANAKRRINISDLPAPTTVFPEFQFFADQFRSPINSNYPRYGTQIATTAVDSIAGAIITRQFDDTTDEAVAFDIFIPSGATNIIFDMYHRAQTAPGAAKQVDPVIYCRQIADNAAPSAWSGENHLTALDIPTSTAWQYDTQTIALSTLSLTAGRLTQFELERDADEAGDNLVGDWNLMLLRVRFS